MTSAATQRIMNKLQFVPDDKESLILNFIATFEQPMDNEEAERKARADAFLASFMNVEIDEQAITDFRERSTI